LKLNEHPALTEERRKIWAKMNRAIGRYNWAKFRCKFGGNPAAKQELRHCAQLIQFMTQRNEELSTVARWCVLLRNDPQLARLVY
jgi:hypothetical protein